MNDKKKAYQPVIKIDTEDILPDYEMVNSMTHCIVVGDNKIVQFCSENYMLIPNIEITKPFEDRLGDEHKAEVHIKVHDDRRFWFNYILKDKSYGDKKDPILPAIKIQNSYDGGLRYKLGFGFYRILSETAMQIPNVDSSEVNVILTHSLGNKKELDEVFERIDDFLENISYYLVDYLALQRKKVTTPEARIEGVIQNTKFPSRQHEAILAAYQNEKDTNHLPDTDWLVYLALSYQLSHNEEIKMQEHKKEKLDFQVLNYLLNT